MTKRESLRGRTARIIADQQGIVIVVVMMLCMIFLVLGLALYWLSLGQIRATETERKDVKAFNVAEAGVDAGMLALKLEWPFTSSDVVDVDAALMSEVLREENPTLYLPSRSDAEEFLQVSVFDNSDADSGETVTTPPEAGDRVLWDANKDGRMFVEASSNVQDDRHRILLLAERQVWNLYFPVGTTLYANAVSANGQGFDIQIEDGGPPVYYDVQDVQGKGIVPQAGVEPLPSSATFDQVITPALLRALEGLAVQKGTYFTSDTAAETFLKSADAPGSVVYIKSASAIDISANTVIGTQDQPVVVIVDTPDGSVNGWDMRGTADFYGILVVLGDTTLKGTCSIHGAVFTSGTLDNKGVGSAPELYYNYTVIKNINRQYVLSVNIVANTWEEYTVGQ